MRSLAILISLCLLFTACDRNTQFFKDTRDYDYPSASGIDHYRNTYYVIGDDATQLMLLDSSLNITKMVPLYSYPGKRVPKNTKADLEAISLVYSSNRPFLFIAGSGSLVPYRQVAWLVDPVSLEKTEHRLDSFYIRLKNLGLIELNIEGMCSTPAGIILSARGHMKFPKNYLVFTSHNFWKQQKDAPIHIVKAGVNRDTTSFQGISGLAYARKSDKLIMTISTEQTSSVYEDGAIGKSYLWVIDNITSKRRWNALNPNRVIDLEKIDQRFKSQKIESVCVIKETRRFIQLALVADNDDGKSTVFRVDISVR